MIRIPNTTAVLNTLDQLPVPYAVMAQHNELTGVRWLRAMFADPTDAERYIATYNTPEAP